MLNTSAHVVPCTPQIGLAHSTPLSCIANRPFYGSESPATPVANNTVLSTQRINSANNVSANHSISLLTPILRAPRRQRLQHIGTRIAQQRSNTSGLSGRPCNTPVLMLKFSENNFHSPQLSVYQNQVVPSCTPDKTSDSGLGDSKTRIKHKNKRQSPLHKNFQRKSAENLKRPYFTEDDEDIFLDYERTNVPADPGYELYDDSTDIFA